MSKIWAKINKNTFLTILTDVALFTFSATIFDFFWVFRNIFVNFGQIQFYFFDVPIKLFKIGIMLF